MTFRAEGHILAIGSGLPCEPQDRGSLAERSARKRLYKGILDGLGDLKRMIIAGGAFAAVPLFARRRRRLRRRSGNAATISPATTRCGRQRLSGTTSLPSSARHQDRYRSGESPPHQADATNSVRWPRLAADRGRDRKCVFRRSREIVCGNPARTSDSLRGQNRLPATAIRQSKKTLGPSRGCSAALI